MFQKPALPWLSEAHSVYRVLDAQLSFINLAISPNRKVSKEAGVWFQLHDIYLTSLFTFLLSVIKKVFQTAYVIWQGTFDVLEIVMFWEKTDFEN